MGDDPTCPCEQRPEHRHRSESVVVEHVHRLVQFAVDAVHHQSSINGDHPGVVGDQQCAALGRDSRQVLEAEPEPVPVRRF